jgi:hypothetical protein
MVSGSWALAYAVVVALLYLIALRLLDLNEKEPWWALGLALAVGVVAALVLWELVSSAVLELNLWQGPLAKELALLAGVAVTIGALTEIGRLRGWPEVHGELDGIVYGAATGLGFATGIAFLRVVTVPLPPALPEPSGLSVLWRTLLDGSAYAVFGGLIGLGFGIAIAPRRPWQKWAAVPLSFGAAYLLQVGYTALSTSGSKAAVWLSWLLPLAVGGVVAVFSLRRERQILDRRLGPEASPHDADLLRNPLQRRREYARLLLSGDFDGWVALRTLHNRLVQLALLRERNADPDATQRLVASIDEARLAVARDLDPKQAVT